MPKAHIAREIRKPSVARLERYLERSYSGIWSCLRLMVGGITTFGLEMTAVVLMIVLRSQGDDLIQFTDL